MLDKNEAKRLRSKTGLTQEEFAQKMGCSATTISLFESGKRTPNGKLLNKMEAYLRGEQVLTPDSVFCATYAEPAYMDTSDGFSTIAYRLNSLARFIADTQLPVI